MVRKVTKFPSEAVSAVRAYVRFRPWRKPVAEWGAEMRRMLNALAIAYRVPYPVLLVIDPTLAPFGQAGRIERRGPGGVVMYVRVKNASIVTFLHEFRHIVQMCRPNFAQLTDEDREEDANAWARAVLERAEPRMYETYVKTGKLTGGGVR